MSEMTKKTLVDEILENARRDRKRLESIADGLTHGFGQLGDSTFQEGEPADPEVSAAFAEEIAKISDSLCKINQQLVELVKIDAKKEEMKPKDPAKMTTAEKEAIYEEMQQEMN